MLRYSRLCQRLVLGLGACFLLWGLGVNIAGFAGVFEQPTTGLAVLVISSVLYLASHAVRMVRLWLLIGGGRLRELLRLY